MTLATAQQWLDAAIAAHQAAHTVATARAVQMWARIVDKKQAAQAETAREILRADLIAAARRPPLTARTDLV